MTTDPIPSGEALLLLATLVSLQLAQGRTVEQLELIAAFFEVLGDNLSLIAARRSMPQDTTDQP